MLFQSKLLNISFQNFIKLPIFGSIKTTLYISTCPALSSSLKSPRLEEYDFWYICKVLNSIIFKRKSKIVDPNPIYVIFLLEYTVVYELNNIHQDEIIKQLTNDHAHKQQSLISLG